MTQNLEALRAALAAEINANGGAASLCGYAIGAFYDGKLAFRREDIGAVFDAHGYVEAAKRARDITPEQALARAVDSLQRTLCSAAARSETTQQDVVTFAVEKLAADAQNKHLRAWGVYRVHHNKAERSSVRDAMGARFFVSPAGVYAAPGLDEHGAPTPTDPACAAIAQDIVAEAQRLLTWLDNASMSRVFDKLYEESACTISWICAGAKLATAGQRADTLADCVLALRAAGVPANLVPLFRGGLTEQGVTESIVRDLQRRLEEYTTQLRADAQGNTRASTFIKRREALQAEVDRVRQYRDLLAGWDETLGSKLSQLRDAYATAQDKALALELPDWVGADSAPPVAEPAPESEPAPLVYAEADAADPFAI